MHLADLAKSGKAIAVGRETIPAVHRPQLFLQAGSCPAS
jgi:hypothetical protein